MLIHTRKMELSFQSIALAVSLAGIVTWIWRVVDWLWWTPKKLERYLKQQGLRGNPYRILVGDLKEESALRNQAVSKPIDFSDDISPRILPMNFENVKNYGKGTYTWFGPTPRVIVMRPDLLKDVLTRLDDFPKAGAANPLSRLLVKGLVTYNGEKWAKHRKIINPAFRFEKIKSMVPTMYLSCSEMMDEWEKMLVSNNEGSSSPFELDVSPHLDRLTSDVISRTAFGSSYNEGRRLFQLQGEQIRNGMILARSVYIPGWRYVPTKMNKRMKEIDVEIRSILMDMIKKREQAMKARESARDLLGIMMESNSNEVNVQGGNQNKGMSIEDIIQECKLFYLAGKETTSVLLVWTMVLLAKYQQWQARAREEIQQIFGSNIPDYEGLGHLKIVTMILYEVIRLYPPVAQLNRKIHNTTMLGEMTLPAGAQISLPTMLIHRDLELWGKDANEFKPERFSEGILKATKGQASFFPFGWGPRICIGQNFALLEAKMALSLILQQFKFELSPSYKHAPNVNPTLQPKYGAQIILHKIKSSM